MSTTFCSRPPLRLVALALCVAAATPTLVSAQHTDARPTGASTFDSVKFGGLHWRSIGPYRGGRVTTVAGVPSQPLTYYMGATGGGVWKTENAGATWTNISDGKLRMGSIGAIAVADDDPNVLYVGMGEAPPRGQSSSWGDGMYKSTDAGKTWRYIGLEKTRAIAKVVVDPRNNDVVYVAAEGSRWTPSADRGIYKSTDGGATWKLLLHPSDSVAAIDLSMDPSNPRILYAAMWDFQRLPWQIRSGGPGSAIYKTTDGGETWTRLSNGLPKGVVGKIGVAVSPANPQRVYAIVEADSGGLYRSDDAGATWHYLSAERVIRSRAWYYTNVIADPQDENVVYVMNAPITKSIDGGKSFQVLPALHGDNHALWINPRNHDDMINGNDGGATVTLDGGKTWSTQDNQPTAQVYRVNTDAQFPYWVYGAQQDNTTIGIASRTGQGGIDVRDWFILGGCESAHVAFDPDHPRYLYAGCYEGAIDEYDRQTGLTRNIMAYPALGLATSPSEQKYRFNWSAPIATSPFDRNVLYHGGNVLFRSSDRGQTWTVISPDLTRNEKEHQGPGGAPITNEGAGGEVYNTIYYIVESPREQGTIWIGTDDGLVQVTRDGGKSWTNVTPKGLPNGFVNAIEVSPWENGTAYITYDGYKWSDYSPYIYKTTDYGRTWTRLVNGIRDGDQVRVVRADPVRRGLLYAGTETGAYVSFDDGQHWQSLQANLPAVPVTDLQVRNGDLVASTEGRAFWILDDITPLEQGAEAASGDTRLFKPRDAYRASWGSTANGPTTGANPPSGATIYFTLGTAADSTGVVLAIVDSTGALIREYSSKPKPGAGPALPASPGMHRIAWDLRSAPLDAPRGISFFGPTNGFLVVPGTYTVRLTANGRQYTQPLVVRPDPRVTLTPSQLADQQQTERAIQSRISEIFRETQRLNSARDQVRGIISHAHDLPHGDSVAMAGKVLAARLDSLSGRLVQPKHSNGQDIINFPNGVVDEWVYLAGAVDDSYAPVTNGVKARLGDLQQQWTTWQARIDDLLGAQLNAFNALLAGAPAVVVPREASKPLP
ncbi:MAG TPA: glycosyl hydrolase [Gemmatimonadaceae bacterium]|nr:glycosyl hydrolase [Gemmatimonadaceae bacterium]